MNSRQFLTVAAVLGGAAACLAIAFLGGGSERQALGQNAAVTGRRQQPGTDMGVYSPRMHKLYDGDYHLGGGKVYMVGGLYDKPGWDHIDNEAKTVHLVPGGVTIDVNELKDTGKFVAKLRLPEGDFEMVMDRFVGFQPCQNGGVASMIFEHGDSGCGDSNWPKTVLYLAGWGYADATLNGKPLYKDYQAHFMVTQGMRDRKTLKVQYPVLNKKTPAGQVNPAAIQIDFFIRSKERDPANKNNPPRMVFQHFFCMEVTWK